MKTNNPNDTSTHPHMLSILTQILIYFITHSHWHAVRIRVSSKKDSKGKFVGDTNWMIFRKIKRFSTSKPKTRDKHEDRETDTRLESKLIRGSSASLPFPDFDLYYLFFFLFLMKGKTGTGLMDPKERTQNICD